MKIKFFFRNSLKSCNIYTFKFCFLCSMILRKLSTTACFTKLWIGISVVGASLKKLCTPNEIYTFGIMHKSFL